IGLAQVRSILPRGVYSSPWTWHVVYWLMFGLSLAITYWLIAFFTNPHAARTIAEEAHYDTKGAAASRMLVIRGVDDEASLSLAAGSIGSRLSYLVLVGAIPALVTMAMFLFFLSELFEWAVNVLL